MAFYLPPRAVHSLEVIDDSAHGQGIIARVTVNDEVLNSHDAAAVMPLGRDRVYAATYNTGLTYIYSGGLLVQKDFRMDTRQHIFALAHGAFDVYEGVAGAYALAQIDAARVINQADWFYMIPPYSNAEFVLDGSYDKPSRYLGVVQNFRGDFLLFEKSSGFVRAAGAREAMVAYSLVCGDEFSYRDIGHDFFDRLYLRDGEYEAMQDFCYVAFNRGFYEYADFDYRRILMNITHVGAPPQVKTAKPRRLLSLSD